MEVFEKSLQMRASGETVPFDSAMHQCRLLLTASLSFWAQSALAHDFEQPISFNIERQPLQSALLEFSRQSHFQILSASLELADYESRSVQGVMTSRAALEALLAGSGLSYVKVGSDTISISRPRTEGGREPVNRISDKDSQTQAAEPAANARTPRRAGVFAWLAAVLAGVGASDRNANAQAPEPNVAEGQLEEVVVTAEKRETNLQRTAIAVTAVDATTIAAAGAENLYDISRLVPNTQFGGQFGASLYIRGIGQQQSSILSDPGATVYVDGVYRPRIAGNTVNFSDVDRAEVLRGPQGTLFGKNAIGGAMNIITAAPTDRLEGDGALQYGSRDHWKADAAANIPITSDLAARVSFGSNTQNGYMHNLATGQRLADTDYYVLRGALLWQITPDLDVTLRSDYTHENQKGSGLKLVLPTTDPYYSTDDYATYGTDPSYLRANDSGVSATIAWRTDVGTLKSISAYRRYSYRFADDNDATPLSLVYSPEHNAQHFFSEELQYVGQAFDNRLDWTTGLFYLDETIKGDQQVRLGAFGLAFDNTLDQNAKSYAAYGQLTYHATERLGATVGLRYSVDHKEDSFVSIVPGGPTLIDDRGLTNTWRAATPKFTLEYQATADAMVYATASKGFKSGGYNGSPSEPSDFQPFDQETLWNYELGLKSEWLDRRLRANLTVYQMNYDGIQTTINKAPNILIENAGDARIRGVEAEFDFLPVSSVLLTAAFGENDFKYTRLNADAQAAGITDEDISANSPKYTAQVGGQYTASFGARSLVLRSDYSWRSKTYFDAFSDEAIAQDSYGLWSARVNYGVEGSWSVFVYGLNLTDTAYHVGGNQALSNIVVIQGAPREIGIGVSVHLGR